MSYFIGIDLGTSSVKLVLIDEQGNMIREANRSYEVFQPAPGWKEVDPEIWWKATYEVLQEMIRDTEKDKIRGIGVTGQMHTLVVLDGRGLLVRPALMWNDLRTADLIPGLKEQIRDTDISYLAGILSTGSPAANMLWIKKEEPDNYKRIRKFLIGPDYIVYRLTGIIGTDFCEASTSGMYDVLKKSWSPVMREIIGIDQDIYPEVRGSAEVAGTILPELSEELGLSSDTVVIVGTGDNPAASIPTGCLGNNYPVFSMGTSGVLMFPRKNLDYKARGKNILFSFDRESFNILVQGVIQSCGSSFSWWTKTVLPGRDFKSADKNIDVDRLGENPLLFYPHLAGDKSIYADPSLRGAFIGLGTDTSASDMTQAVMEGIAFALKQLMEEMHLSVESLPELKVIGGASKSRVWMQILADVLDLPIAQMGGQARAGYGMALLAAYSCGEIDSLASISEKAVSVKEHFLPRSNKAGLYVKKYRQYLRIHDMIKTVL